VLADADLEEAARTAAQSRCINSGQSCIAAKRFIVEAGVFGSFLRLFQTAMQGLVVGDPLQENTQVGPLAREDLRETVHAQVSDAVQKGAELVLGGKPLERAGYFYPPTILVGVKPGMRAYKEEIFGPVASVLRVRDLDEAIAVANDTPFGLGATLWTRDTAKAEWAAARLETGTVFGNGLLRSDPRLPFGGCKESGYGRELSHFGIREFVNVQTVWVKSLTDAWP
jgi:succinate-semialdehyde dehydrogenase/glutarate-semialdehyde dehydrogenase